MSLTLHLGAHKAASTHLQHSLRGIVRPMRAAGIHLIDIRQTRRRGMRLDAALDGRDSMRANRRKWRGYFDLVADTWPRMLVSDENILGSVRRDGLFGPAGIYPDAALRLDQMMQVLQHRPAIAFLAVREPSTFIGSAFSMLVERGIEWVFADYLGGFDPESLSWSGLAERLLAVPGITGLVVWRYEDYSRLRRAVLSEMTSPAIAALAGNPGRSLIGMSQPAHDALRARIERDPTADVAALARQVKAEFPRNRHNPRFDPWGDAVRARLQAGYAQDVARLAAMPGVRLLRPRWPALRRPCLCGAAGISAGCISEG